MNIQTFRADNMHEALQQVRRQLGPDAAVLRTREVRGGLMRWLLGRPQVEIFATGEMATAGRAEGARTVQSAKSVVEKPRSARQVRVPMGEVGIDLAAQDEIVSPLPAAGRGVGGEGPNAQNQA